MVIRPVDLDASIKIKVDPCKWDDVIADNYNNLTIEEIRCLKEGPPECTLTVLLKLGLIERIYH